ncbi:hypothetical protein FRACYDRAFT_259801 [Fragilariopsis cylindrus CCMP1102]|uniref:Tubby C-terminal domain-containing protein n=1 Tax=Fragilariopsis cylindrus CCMP1102 TaxID=635003 RepID=A0A1E7FSM0_9STRA|nr:hypothetical protein FRACYDRAFT_259801 [Fragilariopsis cylindrus CCMP1102]|eukprot:OEU21104.1 hypothetical protein FRACYDRAFT_259801 [Fragilariopsis cylindrus CCMP1102]
MRGGRERRQERRQDRGPVAKVAVGVAGVAVAGAAVAGVAGVARRRGGRSSSPGSSSDEGGGPVTFAMREKLLAFGNDFTINKMSRRRGRGKPAFYCDNKIARLRETFHLRTSRGGKTLYSIQERKARLRDSMAIENADGDKIAEIKKKAIGVVRDNFVVKIRGNDNWKIHGSILNHDFTIKEDGRVIVKVHKKWITPINDCYFIDISDTDDVGLALMVVIGLESLTD